MTIHSSFPPQGKEHRLSADTRMAGDVVKGPWSSRSSDMNRLEGEIKSKYESGYSGPGVTPYDPGGSQTGGGKVVKMPGVD